MTVPTNVHVHRRPSRPTDIVHEVEFDGATAREVFDCFTVESIGAKLWKTYSINLTPGGAMGGAEGYMSGEVVAVERPKLLAWTWKSMDWPAGHPPAVCVFSFDEFSHGGRHGASVVMVKTGVPADKKVYFCKGWEDYFWVPFAKHLQTSRKRHLADDNTADEPMTNGTKKAKTENTGGFICHWEIPVKDLKRASKFYADALGWQVHQFKDDYAVFDCNAPGKKSGHHLLGGGLMKKSGVFATTFHVHLAVESIDKGLARVLKAGGKKVGDKRPVVGDPTGGMEQAFEDTEGNVHKLYQFSSPEVLEKWNRLGPGDGAPPCHIELPCPAKDLSVFKEFYEKVFGWNFGESDAGEGQKYTYWMWQGKAQGRPGGLPMDVVMGGVYHPEEPKRGKARKPSDDAPQQRLGLNVPCVSEWEEKVKAHGGRVVKPKFLIDEKIGWEAECRDPAGNVIFLFEASMKMLQ